eukprot:COSAG01_NODE_216_length_21695_cov_83.368772_14_plen_236_part_00
MPRLDQFFKVYGLSRRTFFAHLKAGDIKLNGQVVTDFHTTVTLPKDRVMLKGELLRVSMARLVYKFFKPKGVITTMDDPKQRQTIKPYLDALKGAVFPVGRLDRESTGLLLLTNDGFLAEKLMHPRYKLKKFYTVGLDRVLQKKDFMRLESGIMLEDGPVLLDDIFYRENTLHVVISEGRNRVIRRMFALLGYVVKHLKRYQVGPIQLGDLGSESSKLLSAKELLKLDESLPDLD